METLRGNHSTPWQEAQFEVPPVVPSRKQNSGQAPRAAFPVVLHPAKSSWGPVLVPVGESLPESPKPVSERQAPACTLWVPATAQSARPAGTVEVPVSHPQRAANPYYPQDRTEVAPSPIQVGCCLICGSVDVVEGALGGDATRQTSESVDTGR